MPIKPAPPAPAAETIRLREAEITGKPPRIPPLSAAEFARLPRGIIDDLQKAAGFEPDGKTVEYIATMLRHPALNTAQIGLSIVLMQGTIGDRDRELAILRTAWLCQAPFEWNAHVNTALRIPCLSSEEIERLTIGSTAPEWTEGERAVLQAAEELFTNAMISDATWEKLAKRLDDQQLLELPVLIGHYTGVAYLQNSIRARLTQGDIGLTAR